MTFVFENLLVKESGNKEKQAAIAPTAENIDQLETILQHLIEQT